MMSQPGNLNEHVRLWLGLYVLGALPTDHYVAISRHLAICPPCRAECDELAEVPAFLALLSIADVEALTDEFSGPKPSPLITAPPGRAPLRSKTTSKGRRELPGRPRMKVGFAAAAFLLFVALGTGVWLKVAQGSPALAATLAASGLDDATGASLFVELTARPDGASVRATVVGPRPGAKLQLFAVTVDGRSVLVQQWAAAGGPQTIAGDLDVAPDKVAFCAMVQMDGSVVVSVQMPGGSGS
jgi:anti-sigma factor RsiW